MEEIFIFFKKIGGVVLSFFQGTGCEIVKFLRTKLKKNKKMDAISALKTDTIQKKDEREEPNLFQKQLNEDIESIRFSIGCYLEQRQRETFCRYFGKYKSKLNEKDVSALEEAFNKGGQRIGELLSTLMGMLESLIES